MARTTKPLTNTEVDKAKPQDKEYNLSDGNGLYLRIKPNGAKNWIFNYFKPNAKNRSNLGLGVYPEISLKQAREIRNEYNQLLAKGIDPKIYRQQLEEQKNFEKSNTFKNLSEKWREKKRDEVQESTINKEYRRLELYALPYLGHLSLNEISAPVVVTALQPLYKKNLNDTLHRLIRMINEIMNFAVNGGLVKYNPCSTIGEMFAKKQKENNPTIPPDKLPELMAKIANAHIEPQTRYLIQWQLLTMVRPREAVSVEWAEIDLEKRLWTIPPEKMKGTRKGRLQHIVPLSTQAIRVLERLKPITGHLKHVFPHYSKPAEHMNSSTANVALKRMGYKDVLTAHGMRSLARTYLADNDVTHEVAEACLAHSVGNVVSQAYNKSTYLEQRIGVMQMWEDYVERCSMVATI
ncbi:tyrosine-type recombinase/integrase [Actinobacillus suis]|uniref:Integrase arm-type DNA-binding domain-containing protein n=1 Tax=Actinobacillus suis TaxID=716 RepID=A0ABT1WWU8_ACTSU|nr:integrase arm-type DNA-binding domain-containing protein [Actinobacillus suis]MCQ9630902.1 integrase arm-type DNA-binding domain-containing protein [Actinobacillus suis]MCQ9633235.1 integrase arm-type DNA-binding domain-containing protein [Actinobacillus suis]